MGDVSDIGRRSGVQLTLMAFGMLLVIVVSQIYSSDLQVLLRARRYLVRSSALAMIFGLWGCMLEARSYFQ